MKNFLDRVQEIRQLEQMATAATEPASCLRCRRVLAKQNTSGICAKCRGASRRYAMNRKCHCGKPIRDDNPTGACKRCAHGKPASH